MKKVIIFLLLTLLINLKTNAQNNSKWADTSAVWHHKYYQFSYIVPGYQKSTYTMDTIINNKLCQIKYSENQVAWPQADGIPIVSTLDYLGKYYLTNQSRPNEFKPEEKVKKVVKKVISKKKKRNCCLCCGSKWLIYDHERDEIVCQVNDEGVMNIF
jgi:hypothetical protein